MFRTYVSLYINEHYIKYIRIVKHKKTGALKLKEHGIVLITSTIDDAIEELFKDIYIDRFTKVVINDPKSLDIPLVLTQLDDDENVSKEEIDRSFSLWCKANNLNMQNYTYIYNVFNDEKGLVSIANKEEAFKNLGKHASNIVAVYPNSVIMKNLRNDKLKNYAIIDLNEKLTVKVNKDGKRNIFYHNEIGMNSIINSVIDMTGSFEKAYDMLKKINLMGESDKNNVNKIKNVIAPYLEEILRVVKEDLSGFTGIDTILVQGLGTLFVNIDSFFSNNLNVRAYITNISIEAKIESVKDKARLIEINEPLALAVEYIKNEHLKVATIKEYKPVQEKDDSFKNFLYTIERIFFFIFYILYKIFRVFVKATRKIRNLFKIAWIHFKYKMTELGGELAIARSGNGYNNNSYLFTIFLIIFIVAGIIGLMIWLLL